MQREIERCWNAGLTLSQTFRRLQERHGFDDKQSLISQWRKLKRKYGCACICEDREPKEMKYCRPIPDPSYAYWKGWAGPGKVLRDLIKEERDRK